MRDFALWLRPLKSLFIIAFSFSDLNSTDPGICNGVCYSPAMRTKRVQIHGQWVTVKMVPPRDAAAPLMPSDLEGKSQNFRVREQRDQAADRLSRLKRK